MSKTHCKHICCVPSSSQIQLSGNASIIFGVNGSEVFGASFDFIQEKNVLPQAELPLICLEFGGQVPYKSQVKSICNNSRCTHLNTFYTIKMHIWQGEGNELRKKY